MSKQTAQQQLGPAGGRAKWTFSIVKSRKGKRIFLKSKVCEQSRLEIK